MHLGLAKLSTLNFREFFKQYLMIVLSVLTALGLEQWMEHIDHSQAAESSSRQIEMELRANLDDLQAAIRTDRTNLQPLTQLDEAITKDIRDGLPGAAINQHIRSLKNKFMLSIAWPSFDTQAWDVAVANQSATWMNVADLHKYSSAYAAQRVAADWNSHGSTIALNAPRMASLQTQLDLGVTVDPVEFVSVLRQMINTLKETRSQLANAEVQLEDALRKTANDPKPAVN